MKVDDKKGAGEPRLQVAQSVARGNLKKGDAIPNAGRNSDKISLSAGTLVSSVASEITADRREKIARISELVKKGSYFDSRPDLPSGIARGISEEVSLLQEIVKKQG